MSHKRNTTQTGITCKDRKNRVNKLNNLETLFSEVLPRFLLILFTNLQFSFSLNKLNFLGTVAEKQTSYCPAAWLVGEASATLISRVRMRLACNYVCHKDYMYLGCPLVQRTYMYNGRNKNCYVQYIISVSAHKYGLFN